MENKEMLYFDTLKEGSHIGAMSVIVGVPNLFKFKAVNNVVA
jgi:hypothetical protein